MSNVNSSEEDVHISRGASIDGKITSGGTVRVAGTVKGEIVCKVLIVQEAGVVSGNVSCKEARVAGTVGEELKVEGSLFIDGRGVVSGKTSYVTLEVIGGGQLNGQVTCIELKKSTPKAIEAVAAERPASRGSQKAAEVFVDTYANANLKIPA